MKIQIQYILILFFYALTFTVNAQINNDTLNKYNENKQKQGYWKVYLTEKLIETKDSTKAYFFAFDYYEEGIQIGFFSIADNFRKNARKIIFENEKPVKGEISILNGNIKYFDKDSISLDETYVNGIPILRQSFVWDKNRKCKFKQNINYNHQYKGEKGSFEYTYLYFGEAIDKRWFRKKNNSWSFHQEIDKRQKIKEIFIYKYNIFLSEVNIISKSEKNQLAWFDLCYQGNIINNKLNYCINVNYVNFFAGRYGIGLSHSIGTQYSKTNNAYSNLRDSNLIAQGIAFLEFNISNHYLIINKKTLKVSIFSDCGLNNFYPFNYEKKFMYLKNQNNYMDLKNGISIFAHLNRLKIKAQLYYKNQLFGITNYGNITNFNGLGFSFGFFW